MHGWELMEPVSWREGCRGRWRWCSGQCVRTDAVLVVVAHGVQLLRSWRGCGGLCVVSARSLEFAQIVSRVRPSYQGKNTLYI